MFQEFCMAVMLECLYVSRGREFTLEAMVERFHETLIIDAVMASMTRPSNERIN